MPCPEQGFKIPIHDLDFVPRQGRGTQNLLTNQKGRGGLLDQLCCQAGMTSLNPGQFEYFDRGCPAPISLLSGGKGAAIELLNALVKDQWHPV
jgi:hypothetical protein